MSGDGTWWGDEARPAAAHLRLANRTSWRQTERRPTAIRPRRGLVLDPILYAAYSLPEMPGYAICGQERAEDVDVVDKRRRTVRSNKPALTWPQPSRQIIPVSFWT